LRHGNHAYVEIVAICDEITQRYAGDADLAMRRTVIDALYKKGECLGRLGEAIANDLRSVGGDEKGRQAALLDAFQKLIAKSDANAAGKEEGREIEDEEIEEKVRMTYPASFAVFEEIVRRFGDDSRHEIRLQVAEALCAKGAYSNNPADYDEVVRRYGKDPSPEMREKVNGALLCKARDLGWYGHKKKAVATYEEILRRNEDDRKMTLVALAEKSQVLEELAMYGDHEDESGTLWKRARKAVSHAIEAIVKKLWFLDFEWEMLGKLFAARKAIAVNDEIIRRYGEDASPDVQNEVARAFFRKGDVLVRRYECLYLYDEDDLASAVTAYDEFCRRCGEDAESQKRGTLCKGALLKLLGRAEEARAAFDEFERRFDDRRQAAEAYYEEGHLLSPPFHLREEGVAVLDEVVRRYGEDANPDIQKIVLDSLVKKAKALMEMVDYEKKRERLEEAIAVYDEIARRYGEDANLEIRRVAARALLDKGEVFCDTFHLHYDEVDEALDDALAVFGEVVRRYGGDTDAEIKGVVADALVQKCWDMERLDRTEETIAACDEVARRFGGDSNVALRKKVIEAMRAKGNALGGDAEIAIFAEILRSHDESEEDEGYRRMVAEVFYEQGVALSEQGRFQEALAVFAEYEQRFADTFNSNHRQQLAEAREDAARGKPCDSRTRLGTVTYE
jgi:tetratricopeptide (TPR) repeat protein